MTYTTGNPPPPGYKPSGDPGVSDPKPSNQQRSDTLKNRIRTLREIIAGIHAKALSNPGLDRKEIDKALTKANIKLQALEAELDALDELDIESIKTAIDQARDPLDGIDAGPAMGTKPTSSFHGSGWASRPDSIAVGSQGVASRISRAAYPSGTQTVPLLWHHDPQKPIGVAKLSPRGDGLWADWTVSDTALGRDAMQLIRDSALNGLSIGFTIGKSHKDADGVRVVDACKIQELSLVTFPADAGARIVVADGQPVTLHCAPACEVTFIDDVWAQISAAEAELRQGYGNDRRSWRMTQERLAGTWKGRTWQEQVAEAEAALNGEKPRSKPPARAGYSFLRGRYLTPEERQEQDRAEQVGRLHEAVRRDPSLARMETHALLELIEAQHDAATMGCDTVGAVAQVDPRTQRISEVVFLRPSQFDKEGRWKMPPTLDPVR